MQQGNDKVKLTRRGCNIIYTVTEGRGWGVGGVEEDEHVFRIIKALIISKKKMFWRHHARKLKDNQCRTTHVEALHIKMRKA